MPSYAKTRKSIKKENETFKTNFSERKRGLYGKTETTFPEEMGGFILNFWEKPVFIFSLFCFISKTNYSHFKH